MKVFCVFLSISVYTIVRTYTLSMFEMEIKQQQNILQTERNKSMRNSKIKSILKYL